MLNENQLTVTFGIFSFIFLASPVKVPPVPAPATIMSTFPEIQKASCIIQNSKEVKYEQ